MSDFRSSNSLKFPHDRSLRRDHIAQSEIISNAVLKTLNDAIAADCMALQVLLNVRVPCTVDLLDHKTIECSGDWPYRHPNVGALGIINGILRSAGIPTICSVLDDNGDPQHGQQLVAFKKYEWPDGKDPFASERHD